MTAHEAMIDILDINESLESIKNRNNNNTPDLIDCKVSDLLCNYRMLLIAELKATELEAFNANK